MKSKARPMKRMRAKQPKSAIKASRTLDEILHGPGAAIAKAAIELRRGMPVVVTTKSGDAWLVAAAELASSGLIDAFDRWTRGTLHVLLTHQRASTLKIRLYTDKLVAVPLVGNEKARVAQLLADPTRDLNDPLMGP